MLNEQKLRLTGKSTPSDRSDASVIFAPWYEFSAQAETRVPHFAHVGTQKINRNTAIRPRLAV